MKLDFDQKYFIDICKGYTKMKKLKELNDDTLLHYYSLLRSISKRAEDVRINGYSTKYAYHLVRLLSEIEQILEEHDLDLQRSKAMLKSIRNGEWSLSQIEDFFSRKEKLLEELKLKSTLREAPEEDKIKQLLLDCLEMHYGSLEECIKVVPDIEKDMQRILEITNKYN